MRRAVAASVLAVASAVVVATASFAADAAAASAASAASDTAAGTIARLRAHTSFLADDTLRGRDTGSPEYAIAATYAATRFAELGLEPGGGNGSFLQPVSFAESRLEAPTLVVRRGGDAASLVAGEDFVMLAGFEAKRLKVDAPLVFVGRGIRAPELGVDDYAGLDVRGKVVLLFGGAPATFPNDQRAHYSSRRLKAELAEQAGAVGIVSLFDAGDEKRVPWERIASHADRPRTSWRDDGGVADAFPGLQFAATLSRAGATKLLAATAGGFDALQKAIGENVAERRELPIRLSAGGRVTIASATSPNVAAILRGSDPERANEYVVVSAHLDHVGVLAPVDGDPIYNGFYDNAVGSAIALETARALATAPARPARSILFLLVTGEERGLLGSDYFAHHPTVPPASIVADVNVDMPLLFGPLAGLVAFGAEHSSLGAIAEAAAMARGLALVPDPMPEEVIFVRSDQYSFVRRGVPSVYLNPVAADEKARGLVGKFLRTHYHQPSDQTDLPIDWQAAADFTALQADIVRRTADAATRPSWNAGDFFGGLFGAPSAGN